MGPSMSKNRTDAASLVAPNLHCDSPVDINGCIEVSALRQDGHYAPALNCL